MALIKCSKCSGTVSTKAPACPHCGSVTFNETSETKSVEKLADQLGSMSEAIASLEQHDSSLSEENDRSCPAKNSTVMIGSRPRSAEETNNLILQVLGWMFSIGLLGLFIYLKFPQYFTEPNTANAEYDTAPEKREPLPAYGKKSEQFSLEELTRVPKPGSKF